MNLTVGITTFKRPEAVLKTLDNLSGVPTLVNINDGDSQLCDQIRDRGFQTVLMDKPKQMFEGMASLIRNSQTDWLLITSDEDPVIVGELQKLERFAVEHSAGVVSTPVWWRDDPTYGNNRLKPCSPPFFDNMDFNAAIHPEYFHQISFYFSGTLFHRPTALEHLSLIEELAPHNQYVYLYTLPALVALMGMTRNAYIYPHAVIWMRENLPTHIQIPDSTTNYWDNAQIRREQHQHCERFLNVIKEMNPDYGQTLTQSGAYAIRGWLGEPYT